VNRRNSTRLAALCMGLWLRCIRSARYTTADALTGGTWPRTSPPLSTMGAQRTITIAWSRSQGAVYPQAVLTWVRYHRDKRRRMNRFADARMCRKHPFAERFKQVGRCSKLPPYSLAVQAGFRNSGPCR
jgi:hypothetical protein